MQVQAAKGAAESYCRSWSSGGSAGHNELNKMHISMGRKSVIRDQHINLTLQPWCRYYRQAESEWAAVTISAAATWL